MSKKYTVYIHTTPSNKAYVGITCQKPTYRWNGGRGYKQHKYFYAAIEKYGWENITHTIFEENLTKDEACRLEKILIALFETNNRRFGYNLSIGGDVGTYGVKLSEERRKRISECSKGRKKTQAEKEKIRQAHLGKVLSNETKRKLSELNKGKTLSEETKIKISEAMQGKVYSTSTPIYCVELDKVFPSSTKASEYIGHAKRGGNILKACKGQVKTAYGYHWRYVS